MTILFHIIMFMLGCFTMSINIYILTSRLSKVADEPTYKYRRSNSFVVGLICLVSFIPYLGQFVGIGMAVAPYNWVCKFATVLGFVEEI